MQTFTFYASEDKLENRGNYSAKAYGVSELNEQVKKAKFFWEKKSCTSFTVIF